jgi:preprotein translocase subunit SecA
MAQRDPLVEYQREGYTLFEAMNDAIKEESIGYLFNVEVEVNPAEEISVEVSEPQDAVQAAPKDGFEAAKAIRAKGLEAPKALGRLHYSAPSDDYSVQERDEVNSETRPSRKLEDPRGGSKKNRSKNKSRRR